MNPSLKSPSQRKTLTFVLVQIQNLGRDRSLKSVPIGLHTLRIVSVIYLVISLSFRVLLGEEGLALKAPGGTFLSTAWDSSTKAHSLDGDN